MQGCMMQALKMKCSASKAAIAKQSVVLYKYANPLPSFSILISTMLNQYRCLAASVGLADISLGRTLILHEA